MALTAIKVADECIAAWNEIKIGHKYRYVIFDMSKDMKEVVVLKKAEPTATYDDFLDDLPPKDCRYAVYDYTFTAGDHEAEKLVFIVWCPDTAPVRRKMVVASTKATVKNAFAGVAMELQATDDSEIAEAELLKKCLEQTR